MILPNYKLCSKSTTYLLDQNGESPLHCASKEGLYSVVQTMCALGCKVDVVNKNGQTPLHQSARVGHTEVVRCLLLSGAQPEFPNKVCKTNMAARCAMSATT